MSARKYRKRKRTTDNGEGDRAQADSPEPAQDNGTKTLDGDTDAVGNAQHDKKLELWQAFRDEYYGGVLRSVTPPIRLGLSNHGRETCSR